MAETTKKQENEVQDVQVSAETTPVTTAIALTDEFTDFEELATNLDGAKRSIAINPKWIEFKTPGETLKCIFLGIFSDEFTNRDTGEAETKSFVRAMDSEKRIVQNSGVNLIQSCKLLTPGQPIEIEYTGTKQRTKQYSVYLLR